ncbi:hypothetical protein LF817_00910 [Halobacillus sp. A1]|uniref:DUF7010 family protein n=1 Tax=Halobacillus sp. A1 TaxID=2880262 RepID=UPI0020A6BA81|nr:hypothetical protein [Halobacillus sp. A1]MCP3029891.1 hypothetical protein [Halobacillus sp. A1]
MNISEMKSELAIKSKHGISFLTAAVVVWLIITVVFLLPIEITQKNVFMLFTSGLTFPLSIISSKLFDVDWKAENLPLSVLGLYLNLAQLMYFPIIFLVFTKSVEDMAAVFAIITAAHLFPYGWLYDAKAYSFFSPVVSVLIFALSLTLSINNLWLIPLLMCVALLVLTTLLYRSYKRKLYREEKTAV